MSIEAVIEQAMKLSVEERAELVERLQANLEDEAPADPNWQAAWTAELDRRIADIREGRVKLVDAADVFSEARAIARRR
jgi:putative addiction module component (TIGR02574 family)